MVRYPLVIRLHSQISKNQLPPRSDSNGRKWVSGYRTREFGVLRPHLKSESLSDGNDHVPEHTHRVLGVRMLNHSFVEQEVSPKAFGM